MIKIQSSVRLTKKAAFMHCINLKTIEFCENSNLKSISTEML